MLLPQVAIIGRPNVGKSSLLNRLSGRRISIVDPTPGVTRDRVTAIVSIPAPGSDRHFHGDFPRGPSKTVEMVDTGGYGVYTADGKQFDEVGADLSTLTDDIEDQINFAAANAQIILFVVDAQDGITALDETIASMLRTAGFAHKVLMVANKVDDSPWESHALDAARLGFGEVSVVSAKSGYRKNDFLDRLYTLVDSDALVTHVPPVDMKLAIVGRRNAGKSTLINTLAGEPRVIVSEIAGTTRDSVDVKFEIEGKSLLAIDTAGVRKRKSFQDDIEFYAHHRMQRSIRRADVVFLMIDATEEVSQVDKKLSLELQKLFKPTVIVINKWDKVKAKLKSGQYADYLTQELQGLDYAPIVFVSAQTGEGVRDAVAMAFNLQQQANHRESTGRLNAVFQEIMAKRGPSSKLGTKAKVFYLAQIGVNPPTIVMVVNQPRLFEGGYERYMLNELRERLPYSEVPIRLVVTQRKRKTLSELKAGHPPAADPDAPPDFEDFSDEPTPRDRSVDRVAGEF
jgi:GTPase